MPTIVWLSWGMPPFVKLSWNMPPFVNFTLDMPPFIYLTWGMPPFVNFTLDMPPFVYLTYCVTGRATLCLSYLGHATFLVISPRACHLLWYRVLVVKYSICWEGLTD